MTLNFERGVRELLGRLFLRKEAGISPLEQLDAGNTKRRSRLKWKNQGVWIRQSETT